MGELMALSKSNVLDGIPESYQEYIVTIYRLSAQSKIVTNIDIAQKMKNAPSSVYNMLVKLKDRNLLDWEPKKKAIRLSEEGVKIGKRLILGHLIMELFLREYLGLEDQD
jgi:Mn-dependent DtxR family transcriptional regulator